MKKLTFVFALLLVSFLAISLLRPANTSAAFNQNLLIDDVVFSDSGSLSVAQIDAFLNSFSQSCISPNSGFQSIIPAGYSPSTGFSYGGFVSAGQVIATSAQVYGLNPKALIVTLEKEQSLVSGRNNFAGYCNNGSEHKYAAAVGYGCPDSLGTFNYSGISLYKRNGVEHTNTGDTCVNGASKAGFSQQVIRAAWLLKFGQQRSLGNVNWAIVSGSWDNSDDPQSCYGGPMTQGYRQVCPSGATTYYDGYKTIDGAAVHMDSGATAGLYWYTPHFHGNQNFVSLFEGWFGPTVGTPLVRTPSNGTYYLLTNDKKFAIPNGDILYAYGIQQMALTVVSDEYLNSISDGGVLSTIFTVPGNGTVYLADGGKKYGIPSGAQCTRWGLACGTAVQKEIGASTANVLIDGGVLKDLMGNQGGIYLMENGEKRPFYSPKAMTEHGYGFGDAISIINFTNAVRPIGFSLPENNSFVKFSASSGIYLYANSNFYGFGSANAFKSWLLPNAPVFVDGISKYNQSLPSVTATLDIFANFGDGKKYLLDSGAKIDLTPYTSDWPAATDYSSLSSFGSLMGLKATIVSNTTLRLPSGAMYKVSSQSKLPFGSVHDYFQLGYTSNNLLQLNSNDLATMSDGYTLLAEGSIYKKQGADAIYVKTSGNSSYTLVSLSQIPQFKLYADVVPQVTQLTLDTYPASTTLKSLVTSGGQYYVVVNGQKILVPAAMYTHYNISGLQNVSFSTTFLSQLSTPSKNLDRFIQNSAGTIFYIESSQKRPISSYATFTSLGGNANNTNTVPDDFANQIPTGSVL